MNFTPSAFTSPGDWIRPCRNGLPQGTPFNAALPATLGTAARVTRVDSEFGFIEYKYPGQITTPAFRCRSWVRVPAPVSLPAPAPKIAPPRAEPSLSTLLADLLPDLIAHLEVTTAQLGLYIGPEDAATRAIIATNRALLDRVAERCKEVHAAERVWPGEYVELILQSTPEFKGQLPHKYDESGRALYLVRKD